MYNIIADIIQKYRGIFAIVTTLLVAALLVVGGVALSLRWGKVGYTVSVVPSDASVTMNGIKVTSGTYYLAPGQYTVIATSKGFANYKKTVNVAAETNTLSVPLVPVSAEATTWANQHRSLYKAIATTVKESDSDKASVLKTQNPITSNMPFQNMLFSINYHADPTDVTNSRIIIDITANQAYRQSAIFQIRQWGYDPTDYKIEFSEYTSPFVS